VAAEKGYLEVVSLLLDRGADLEAKDTVCYRIGLSDNFF
jgi:ankyrin repeat protein